MSIVDEIQQFLSSHTVQSLIFNPIGDIAAVDRSALLKFIKQAMVEQPSHAVKAIYSMGNIVSRPYRFYAIIGSLDRGILLNVDPDRSWMIAIDYRATEEQYQYFQQLLEGLSEVFFFSSGARIDAIASKLFATGKFDKTLQNTVYRLESLDSALDTACNPEATVILHPTIQTAYDKVRSFYKYQEPNFDDIPNTHVVLELDDVIVAGARSNEEFENYAVVGGVHTMIDQRHQKLGFTVCYHLIEQLKTNFDHIYLETDVDNFPAIKIYEKLGFVKIGSSAFYERGVDMISGIIGDRNY